MPNDSTLLGDYYFYVKVVDKGQGASGTPRSPPNVTRYIVSGPDGESLDLGVAPDPVLQSSNKLDFFVHDLSIAFRSREHAEAWASSEGSAWLSDAVDYALLNVNIIAGPSGRGRHRQR